METLSMSFCTKQGPYDKKGIKHNIVIPNIPEHIIIECAQRYITILLQHQLRNGVGEYGKLKILNETLSYKEI